MLQPVGLRPLWSGRRLGTGVTASTGPSFIGPISPAPGPPEREPERPAGPALSPPERSRGLLPRVLAALGAAPARASSAGLLRRFLGRSRPPALVPSRPPASQRRRPARARRPLRSSLRAPS